jgi:anti-anti-sigma factor
MHDQELTYALLDGPKEGLLILELTGPVTLGNLFGFQDYLRAQQPAAMIIDMTNVPYMDSAGLGLILNFYVSAEKAGRRLSLAAVNQRIMALFQLTRVDTVLALHPTVDAAIATHP